jgi:hypothetical protein
MASTHPIYDTLQGLGTPAERAAVKAQALASLANLVGKSVSRTVNGHVWKVTLMTAPTYSGGTLTFDLSLKRDGVDVTPPDLNPVSIHNPPVLVSDANGDIVQTWTDRLGVVHADAFREDLLQALLTVVADVVKASIA